MKNTLACLAIAAAAFLAGSSAMHSQPPLGRTPFSYELVPVPTADVKEASEGKLNTLGGQGGEVVGVVPGTSSQTAFFVVKYRD